MNDTEHARTLLAAAERDLRALNAMGDTQTFADEIPRPTSHRKGPEGMAGILTPEIPIDT
jgi:hypothetical protein